MEQPGANRGARDAAARQGPEISTEHPCHTESLDKPQARSSWRDVLAVHPAAEMFPRMSPDDLKALAEDIGQHGLRSPIAIIEKPRPRPDGTVHASDPPLQQVLDGISRLDAMESAGIRVIGKDGQLDSEIQRIVVDPDEVDPVSYVISVNLHRRHLNAEQRRDLIAKLLKASPDKSDRQIAEQTKVDHKTVGKVRTALEATGEIPQLTKTKGKDGKARSARKTKDPSMLAAADRAEHRAEENRRQQQEVSPGQRKAFYANTPSDSDDLSDGVDHPQPSGMNDAVATFFDSANGTEIYARIPFDRRAEVNRDFLRILVSDGGLTGLLTFLFEHGTIWEASADIIASRIFETASRTKAAAIGAKLRALTAPKSKSSDPTKFPKLTMEKTVDAEGKSVHALPRGNRSRTH